MQPPFRVVLCPSDLSPVAASAVPVAYRLAADGATVHLLHVAEPPYLGNPLFDEYVQGYVPTSAETEAGTRRVRAALEALVPEGSAARGVTTRVHVVEALNVAASIQEQVDALGVELVVLGTRGRTGLARLLLGSVATDVLRAKVPVVLVHDVAPATTDG